jgi:hypothetical protein
MSPQSKIENRQDSGWGMKTEVIVVKPQRTVVFEPRATAFRSWILESLSSLKVILQLNDSQTRYSRYSAVVGQEPLAIAYQRGRHLDRIGRLEFEHCSKLRRSLEEATIYFDKPQTATIGQQRLITIGKRGIAEPIRYDQNFHQTEAGCHCQEIAAIDRFEQRLNKRKKTSFLPDKVDENVRIERDRAGFKVLDQSHARRSLFTCLPASAFFQTSFPSPWSSKMESGLAFSVATLRI